MTKTVLQALDMILDDEFSSSRASFQASVSQTVADQGLLGGRFSSALRGRIESLASAELRERAARILAVWHDRPEIIRKSVPLERLVAWANGRLNREESDISEAISGVDLGDSVSATELLRQIAHSTAKRLSAELTTLHSAATFGVLNVEPEPPDWVKHGKWFWKAGRRNFRWILVGLAFLLLSGLVSSLINWKALWSSDSVRTSASKELWERNLLTVNDQVLWDLRPDGTSATNRQKLLGILSSLDLATAPEIGRLRDELAKAVRSAPPKLNDPNYDMQARQEMIADLDALRRAIRSKAIAAGVKVEG